MSTLSEKCSGSPQGNLCCVQVGMPEKSLGLEKKPIEKGAFTSCISPQNKRKPCAGMNGGWIFIQ